MASLRRLFRRRQTRFNDDIEIRGGAEFQRCTQEALLLLQSLPEFETIRTNIAVIRQGKRSGMKAWAKPPTFVVGKPTWSHSPVWYAGAIAHDAFHAALYAEAKKDCDGAEPEDGNWTGAEAEKKCLAFQRGVLIALNADDHIIHYIDRCAENPTYQGNHQGWRSWLDYLNRRW